MTPQSDKRAAKELAEWEEVSKIAGERWKAIDASGSYEVSDHGRVRSWVRRGPGSARRVAPLLMKATAVKSVGASSHYRRVALRLSGKHKSLFVNRLVCRAFHGEPPTAEHQAAHKNRDSLDNRASNLYWATPKGNAADKTRHGTTVRGSKSNLARLTEEQVKEVRALHDQGISIKSLGRVLNMQTSSLSRLVRGETWKHVE